MRPRLLVVGHAGIPTGYARVLRELLPRLTPSVDVTLFAFNYKLGALPHEPVPTRTNELRGDVLGRDQLPAMLDELQPDLVLLHHDADVYEVHAEALEEYRSRHRHARVIVYCPIEWESTSRSLLRTLGGVDVVVTYTRFGRTLVEESLPPRGRARVLDLPHGADPGRFRPIASDRREQRLKARRALFPGRADLEDAFIVLNANRNSPRKRIDLTLRAFAEFATGKNDVFLCLHMGLRDSGIDVRPFAESLGIAGKVLHTTAEERLPDLPDETLNLIYNACDVGLNTSTGEGWGLVPFEHGATGAPQIVPDHSACAELWRGKAILVPVEEGREDDGVVSLDATVAALERTYADPALRRRLGEAARRNALDPRFDWDTIAESWRTLLEEEAQRGGQVRPDDLRAVCR